MRATTPFMPQCDRLTAFYLAKTGDPSRASQAARLHWSTWRSYLSDLAAQGRASRQALVQLLRDAGFRDELVEAGDNVVIDEIADLILLRFRRAPQHAKAYAKCLISTAVRMGQARG
jgi:hypothetical protein